MCCFWKSYWGATLRMFDHCLSMGKPCKGKNQTVYLHTSTCVCVCVCVCRSTSGICLYLSHHQPPQLQLLPPLPPTQRDGPGRGRGGRGGRLRPAPPSSASTVSERVHAEGQLAPLSHLLQYKRVCPTEPVHPPVLPLWAFPAPPVLWSLQPHHRHTHGLPTHFW